MLGRRFLVLSLVLVGLALLAAQVAPREDAAAPAVPSQAVSPGPAEISGRPAPAPTVAEVPGEPRLTRIEAGREFDPIAVRVGERVRLLVSGARESAVQVGPDGPIESIDPLTPARFDLLYSTPGRREVRVFGPGLSDPRVIGSLEVGRAG